MSSSSISHRYSASPPSTVTPFRSVLTPRGVIPQFPAPEYDSGIRKPDSNTENFLKEKAREQWAITKQTYRTLPLIEPKPKVRRDYPTTGLSYMKLMDGPTWHDIPKTIVNPNPPKLQEVMNRYGHDVRQNNPNVVHLQYNSPLGLHQASHENILTPLSGSPGPRPGSVTPHVMPGQRHQLQKPINVDITQSPTYNLLQEEEENRPLSRASPRHSPIGLHSPSFPKQTPYFKSLMNSLLPGI